MDSPPKDTVREMFLADKDYSGWSTTLHIVAMATNVIWRPVDVVDIGINIGAEYRCGQREDKDRSQAVANRLQFNFIWLLPS